MDESREMIRNLRTMMRIGGLEPSRMGGSREMHQEFHRTEGQEPNNNEENG